MRNEIILLCTIIIEFSLPILSLKLFKKQGLILWMVIATIAANIEVMILVRAFGMEMTLGNILFASTFLITDIASEVYGEKETKNIVKAGIFSFGIFTLISASWMLYMPSENDIIKASIDKVFAHTPRIMFASLAVYIVVQFLDIYLYHRIWQFTKKQFNDAKRFLWLRNNVATIISQIINSVLYTLLAFYGVYPLTVLIKIMISTCLIFIATSIIDTPFLYLARRISLQGNK